MKDSHEFLEALRRSKFQKNEKCGSEKLYLQILDVKGDYCLRTLGDGFRPETPDWHCRPVREQTFLKRYARIADEDSGYFNWTDDTAGNEAVSLSGYPDILQLAIESGLPFVDDKRQTLEVDDSQHRALLKITAETKPLRRFRGDFLIDGEKVISFLSENIALTEKGLSRVMSVGDNYSSLMAFTEPFTPDRLESFLSIFFSSCSNLGIEVEEHRISYGKSPVKEVPTLMFEKVDADNTLYLRVTTTLGNLPESISENFYLSKVVSDEGEGELKVRPVEGLSLPELVETVRKDIVGNAPTRAAGRDVWRDDNVFVIPAETVSPFLQKSLPVLLGKFRLIGAEKLKSYRITAAKPKLNVKIGSGIDFLEGTADVEISGDKFSLNDLLSQYSRNRYVTLSDGNKAILDSDYMKRLQRIFIRGKGHSDKVKVSFFDLPEIAEMLDDANMSDRTFAKCRKFFEGFNLIKTKRVTAPNLKATLRPYQQEGLRWLNYLYENNMGGCLADDMGLGKTVQTIAMLCKSVPKQESPSIILMPKSLLFNWKEEFKKFAPHISVTTYYGPERDLTEAMKAQVIMTSYAVARNDIEQLCKQEFDYIILDESQNIKNTDAQVTKAVWLLRGRHRLAISGTPVENNLTELYSLFRFLNPAMFGTLKSFNELYASPIQRDSDEDAARALRKKIYPFMLRRLKEDVLTDLPERTEQTLIVEMSESQRAFYEERRRYFAGEVAGAIAEKGVEKARFELLRALGELRQIASIPEEKSDGAIASPKIDLLVENVVQAVENGHKTVVFFNFLAGIELTGKKLEKAGVGYDVMTGATSDRQRVVENFRDNPDCKVLLMTVKTGGTGLNLVNADTVFIAEPWWNKAAEDQAVNRLHRIGQKNPVNCYYLITQDTIEEKIRLLQEQKSALVDAIISSDAGAKTLSSDEIDFLLAK